MLALTADVPDCPAEGRLRSFRSLLLLHAAVQAAAWVLRPLPPPAAFPPKVALACAGWLGACAALSVSRTWGRTALAWALPALALQWFWTFPLTDNHNFLLGVCALALVAVDPRRETDAALGLQALRWVTVIVLFHTGLQKLTHGYYFGGEFLAWAVAGGGGFASVFGWMLPADELARLVGLSPFAPDSGPYRVASLPFLALSNAVWIFELALPVALVWRRTRGPAALVALAFVLALQLGARELMFGALFALLLLLFLRRDWLRRLAPVFALVYAWLLAAVAGLAPGTFLLRSGTL